jgi:membrane associated rhomboid family serine protease
MGLYDRDYTQDGYQQRYQYAPRVRIGFPRITSVVKWLLIINGVVFLLTAMNRTLGILAIEWFSVFPETIAKTLQLWRLITYQFLHDPTGFGHILINMLWLFFFGPMLERMWGSRKFLAFYLICGAAGGILYPFLTLVGWLPVGPLIGASGAILGIIAACALLFPSMRVFVFGIFPVPMIVLAIVFALISILTLLNPDSFANAGGEAAHLAGMVVGAAYVLSKPLRAKWLMKAKAKKWNKQRDLEQQIQLNLDRILEKVHNSGIHSLSAKEKKILKKATRLEQTKNRF